MFHTTCGGGHMAVINCDNAKEKWEVQNLCKLHKVEFNNKE